MLNSVLVGHVVMCLTWMVTYILMGLSATPRTVFLAIHASHGDLKSVWLAFILAETGLEVGNSLELETTIRSSELNLKEGIPERSLSEAGWGPI